MALTKVTSGVRTIASSEVVTASIADDAVTAAKLADDSVGLPALTPQVDGSIISFDASTNPVLIAPGTATHVLTSAGAGAVAAFAAPVNYIIQMRQIVDVTNRSVTTSGSYATTGVALALSNNLKDTGSKVRIQVTANVGFTDANSSVEFTINDGSADLTPSGVASMVALSTSENDADSAQFLSSVIIDFITSPGATSPKTYTLFWRCSAGTAHLGRRAANATIDTVSATMTLTELDS